MTTTYRMAGLVAPAAASRVRCAAATNAAAWSIAGMSALQPTMGVPSTKQQFGDVLDHRRRRLSEPSP